MIRILVADDHRIFRQALTRLLAEFDDMTVVGEAGTCDEVLEQARTVQFDVLILDLSMPGCGGLELIAEIKARWRDTHILVMSAHAEESHIVQALRAGAVGYMTKDDPVVELECGVRRVASGGRFLCQSAATRMAFEKAKKNSGESSHECLTEREFVIFQKLVAGMRGREIANELSLSEKTISNHKNHVLRKMNLSNRSELVRYAIRHGLAPVH